MHKTPAGAEWLPEVTEGTKLAEEMQNTEARGHGDQTEKRPGLVGPRCSAVDREEISILKLYLLLSELE